MTTPPSILHHHQQRQKQNQRPKLTLLPILLPTHPSNDLNTTPCCECLPPIKRTSPNSPNPPSNHNATNKNSEYYHPRILAHIKLSSILPLISDKVGSFESVITGVVYYEAVRWVDSIHSKSRVPKSHSSERESGSGEEKYVMSCGGVYSRCCCCSNSHSEYEYDSNDLDENDDDDYDNEYIVGRIIIEEDIDFNESSSSSSSSSSSNKRTNMNTTMSNSTTVNTAEYQRLVYSLCCLFDAYPLAPPSLSPSPSSQSQSSPLDVSYKAIQIIFTSPTLLSSNTTLGNIITNRFNVCTTLTPTYTTTQSSSQQQHQNSNSNSNNPNSMHNKIREDYYSDIPLAYTIEYTFTSHFTAVMYDKLLRSVVTPFVKERELFNLQNLSSSNDGVDSDSGGGVGDVRQAQGLGQGQGQGQGQTHVSGILISGISSSGKTTLSHKLINDLISELTLPLPHSLNVTGAKRATKVITIHCTNLISSVIGSTEKRISKLFAYIRTITNPPPLPLSSSSSAGGIVVLLLEGVEVIGTKRGGDTTVGGTLDRVMSCLLVEIDGFHHSRAPHNKNNSSTSDSSSGGSGGLIIIATTPSKTLLDDALLRSGRLGTHINLGSTPSTLTTHAERLIYASKQLEEERIGFRFGFEKVGFFDPRDFGMLTERVVRESLRSRFVGFGGVDDVIERGKLGVFNSIILGNGEDKGEGEEEGEECVCVVEFLKGMKT